MAREKAKIIREAKFQNGNGPRRRTSHMGALKLLPTALCRGRVSPRSTRDNSLITLYNITYVSIISLILYEIYVFDLVNASTIPRTTLETSHKLSHLILTTL